MENLISNDLEPSLSDDENENDSHSETDNEFQNQDCILVAIKAQCMLIMHHQVFINTIFTALIEALIRKNLCNYLM